ncbi:MAG: PsbP-related protein [Candidatus Woesebacteria bacterium]|jgi:hypothetical protein
MPIQNKKIKMLALSLILLMTVSVTTACVKQEAKDSESAVKTEEEAATTNIEEKTAEETETATSEKKAMEGFLVYENDEAKISIQYPSTWETMEGFMGSVALFRAPKESSQDMFQEHVNILLQDLSTQQDMTLEDFTDLSRKQLETLVTDFKVVEKLSKTTLSGVPAQEITYTAKQGQIDMKLYQIWAVKEEKAYIITYTAAPDGFDKEWENVQKIVDSFEIE